MADREPTTPEPTAPEPIAPERARHAEPAEGPSPQVRERRLSEAPSARYATPGRETDGRRDGGSALAGSLARATVVACLGAALLFLVGAVLASTAGLLFVAGATGAATGLVLARAAAPGDLVGHPVPRRRVAWIAVALSVAAVALAATATWLFALQEGGALGLIDYLAETFGPFVPAEGVLAAVAAWWGASAGPVQR